MNSSRKNIIFIIMLVLVIGIAIAGYTYFSGNTPSGPLVTLGPGAQPEALAVTREGILANIQAIKDIKLDVTILADPAFLRLQKVVRLPVEDPGVGRPNPFLPYKTKAAVASPPSRPTH